MISTKQARILDGLVRDGFFQSWEIEPPAESAKITEALTDKHGIEWFRCTDGHWVTIPNDDDEV